MVSGSGGDRAGRHRPAFARLDADGRVREVSSALCELHGRLADQLRGRHYTELYAVPVSITDLESTTTVQGRTREGVPPKERIELQLWPVDRAVVGTVTPLETAGVPSASDERLREQTRKIKELHAVATELETCHSRTGALELMIDAAETILGFEWCGVMTVDSKTHRFVAAAVSQSAPVDVGDLLLGVDEGITGRCYQTGESVLTESTSDDGQAEPVHDEIRSGLSVPIGDLGVFNAVSDRVNAFDETDVELAELLAANVAEATARIDVQNELRDRQAELDLLEQVQSRVLRHNLRNDLSVIQGIAETIRDNTADTTARHAREIIRTADRLVATSENVRQIERVIERGDERRVYNVAAVVDGVVSTQRQIHPDATLTVDCPDLLRIEAHPDLQLAIEALVENAIVHNVGHPHVTVRVYEDDGTVHCLVEDDGPGIPAQEIRVLDRQSETELEHGSGAGLWLVDAIVERSDGEWAFDTSGDGTTVELRLPAATQPSH
jgi:signal transduction histidine kinase